MKVGEYEYDIAEESMEKQYCGILLLNIQLCDYCFIFYEYNISYLEADKVTKIGCSQGPGGDVLTTETSLMYEWMDQ